MAQKKEQWFIIVAGILVLTGAVFACINTFGGQGWAMWVAFGFLVAAVLLYTIVHFARRQFNKKYKPSESEIMAAEQRAANCECPPVTTQLTPTPEPVTETTQTTTSKTSTKKPVTAKKPSTTKKPTTKTATKKG